MIMSETKSLMNMWLLKLVEITFGVFCIISLIVNLFLLFFVITSYNCSINGESNNETSLAITYTDNYSKYHAMKMNEKLLIQSHFHNDTDYVFQEFYKDKNVSIDYFSSSVVYYETQLPLSTDHFLFTIDDKEIYVLNNKDRRIVSNNYSTLSCQNHSNIHLKETPYIQKESIASFSFNKKNQSQDLSQNDSISIRIAVDIQDLNLPKLIKLIPDYYDEGDDICEGDVEKKSQYFLSDCFLCNKYIMDMYEGTFKEI
ncbi:hypothetical protein WA158_003283 [Blastocystis sp. Blastoise]